MCGFVYTFGCLMNFCNCCSVCYRMEKRNELTGNCYWYVKLVD